MKKYIAILLAIVPLYISAAENAKSEALKELVEIMDMGAMMEAIHHQLEGAMLHAQQQLNVNESERAITEKYHKEVNALIMDQLSWENFEPAVMDIYQNHFTESEIKAMVEFYRSDEGQSILEKMPIVMQESMQMSQAMMQDIIPQIQSLTADFERELEAHRNQ